MINVKNNGEQKKYDERKRLPDDIHILKGIKHQLIRIADTLASLENLAKAK